MPAAGSLIIVQARESLPRHKLTYIEAFGNGVLDVAIIVRYRLPHIPSVDRRVHHFEDFESVA
jgi:hypothetical protein